MVTKLKCSYPGCRKEQEYKHNLELINEEEASVDLGFCQYHHLIVVGGHFKAKAIKIIEQITNFELIGPFKEVEIAEQVIGAIEMLKLKSNDKSKQTFK